MAVKDIVLMGDPKLRQKSKPISEEDIHTDDIQTLIDDMVETASQTPENGFITAGLAAPQVGEQKRLFLVIKDGSDKKEPQYEVYINPDIDIESGEVVDSEESCLSTPHLCGVVKRYKEIKISYLDREGKRQKKKVSGDQAIFMQHENDHLDGILWVDKQVDTRMMSYC
jgi:peptide deformylase